MTFTLHIFSASDFEAGIHAVKKKYATYIKQVINLW